jgi:uncharacterized protein (DUF2236 family)
VLLPSRVPSSWLGFFVCTAWAARFAYDRNMAQDRPHFVSADDLENLLAELKTSSPASTHGIFGSDSISWKVNRESALFLAATRAALLQLAHPWVATAIAQHSKTFQDPIARFHQTFRVMFTMSFGTAEQAFAAARQLHRRHQGIRGTLPETAGRFAAGTSYEANEVDALLWVYATLVDSSLLAYELVLPALTDVEREQYYSESRQVAPLFGIPRDCLPADWAGFDLYMKSALRSNMLGVTPATREMAHQLQNGAGLAMRLPFWYRSLNVELLPPRFREEFHFTYGERERRSAERALWWTRRIYPHLPQALRFVGPYNEALCRLNGRRAGIAVRVSNKLWIGRPELFYSQIPTGAGLDSKPASRRNVTES